MYKSFGATALVTVALFALVALDFPYAKPALALMLLVLEVVTVVAWSSKVEKLPDALAFVCCVLFFGASTGIVVLQGHLLHTNGSSESALAIAVTTLSAVYTLLSGAVVTFMAINWVCTTAASTYNRLVR